MTYATDTDLLHWEPALFKDATLPSQTLIAGTAAVTGTAVTIAAGSFTTAGIVAGHVLTLGTPLEGSFPIVAVSSATVLSVSVLYDRLTPDDTDTPPRPIGSGTNVPYTIKTFLPQIGIVSEMLRRVLEVSDAAQILNPLALRRSAALGTLQMLYSAAGAIALDDVKLSAKAVFYERLYRRALRVAKVEIDQNGDGVRDSIRCPGIVQLRRSA